MPLKSTTALAIGVAIAGAAPAGAAMARTRMVHGVPHHVRMGGAYSLVRQGRSPAYAPPAPIGVGLFGTGLFYGYGFPVIGSLGF